MLDPRVDLYRPVADEAPADRGQRLEHPRAACYSHGALLQVPERHLQRELRQSRRTTGEGTELFGGTLLEAYGLAPQRSIGGVRTVPRERHGCLSKWIDGSVPDGAAAKSSSAGLSCGLLAKGWVGQPLSIEGGLLRERFRKQSARKWERIGRKRCRKETATPRKAQACPGIKGTFGVEGA